MEFKISKKFLYNEQNQALDFKKAQDVPQDAKNWRKYCKENALSSVFIEKYTNQLDWSTISESQSLDLEFALSNQSKFSNYLYYNVNLSEKFMLNYPNFIDYADWGYILRCKEVSENLLRKIIPTLNEKRVGWIEISSCQILTESFMEEFAENLEWTSVCYNQVISEKFMEKFIQKIEWNVVSYRQKMSDKFLRKYEKSINWPFFFNLNQMPDSLAYNLSKESSDGVSEKFEREMREKYL